MSVKKIAARKECWLRQLRIADKGVRHTFWVNLLSNSKVCFLSMSIQLDGYKDDWSQFKVHTNERTQVHGIQSSLAVTHSRTNPG